MSVLPLNEAFDSRGIVVKLFLALLSSRRAIVALLMLWAAQPAAAGWYKVDNYEGTVGGRPIRVSLQRYEFGSGITVQGSYYETAERRPVPLYGMSTDRGLVLCAIHSEAELERIVVRGSKTGFYLAECPLVLLLDGARATGTWKQDGTDRVVTLKRTASLDDSGEPVIVGAVDIPFWAQTETHMLVGRYENTASGVCMSKLAFVNKQTGKTDQQLQYGGDPCDAGMIMTPIYMNVQIWAQEGKEIVSVNFRDGGAGYEENYAYDAAANKFVKEP